MTPHPDAYTPEQQAIMDQLSRVEALELVVKRLEREAQVQRAYNAWVIAYRGVIS